MGWTTPTTWTTGQVPSAADLNAQIRDNLNAVGQHDPAWSTYAPVMTGSITNPTGQTAAGQYVRVGRIVTYSYLFTRTGTTVGEGDYSVSLPVTGYFDHDLRCGAGWLYDASALDGWVTCHYSSSTNASTVKLMWNAKTANGIVTHNSPAGWGVGDKIAGMLIYRAAT